MKRFAAKSIADYEAAKQYLSYDPLTGLFVWIKQTSDKTVVGKEAGTLTDNGYIEIIVLGCRYRAHRLAWYFHYNELPPKEVDHRNTIKHNNWIENLRDADRNQNMCNRRLQSNNKSGYKGVWWDKRVGRFKSAIRYRGKVYELGFFDCPKQAHSVYRAKAVELHGEFVNFGN